VVFDKNMKRLSAAFDYEGITAMRLTQSEANSPPGALLFTPAAYIHK
jgi:hypothetical protein